MQAGRVARRRTAARRRERTADQSLLPSQRRAQKRRAKPCRSPLRFQNHTRKVTFGDHSQYPSVGSQMPRSVLPPTTQGCRRPVSTRFARSVQRLYNPISKYDYVQFPLTVDRAPATPEPSKRQLGSTLAPGADCTPEEHATKLCTISPRI